MPPRDVDERVEVVARRQRARRVVREVDDDQPRARPDQVGEAAGSKRQPDFSSGSQKLTSQCIPIGDLVERLIGREGADDVVAVADEAVDGEEDELLGRGDQDVVGTHATVETGDLGAQQRDDPATRCSRA